MDVGQWAGSVSCLLLATAQSWSEPEESNLAHPPYQDGAHHQSAWLGKSGGPLCLPGGRGPAKERQTHSLVEVIVTLT